MDNYTENGYNIINTMGYTETKISEDRLKLPKIPYKAINGSPMIMYISYL